MTENNRAMACHTTPRLVALAKILQNAVSVADIGCDHAYLPIMLARMGVAKKIIASDINEGPLLRARQNVERFGLLDKIELRLGGGLDTLQCAEAEAIVIAGMGGNVIADILEGGAKVAKAADFIALQPMTGVRDLREYLYKNGYVIEREVLVREDRRIYTIIIAKSGQTGEFSELDCYISPALQRGSDDLYGEYFARQRSRIKAALNGLRRAKRQDEKTALYEKLLGEFDRCKGEIDKR